MESLKKYFPDLDAAKAEQLKKYAELLLLWNTRINLISRQDTSRVIVHHILHSLSILKCHKFPAGSRILDLGTGGGLPGIPLAICLPDCVFTLVDSRGKKVKAVADMASKLGLGNVNTKHSRAEELTDQFDVVVTRAVAPFADLINWTRKTLKKKGTLIALKGGNIDSEINAPGNNYDVKVYPISDTFDEEYFKEKWVVKVMIHE